MDIMLRTVKEIAAIGALLLTVLALAAVGIKAQDWVEEIAQTQVDTMLRRQQVIIDGIEEDVLAIKYALRADSVVTNTKLDAILEALNNGSEDSD